MQGGASVGLAIADWIDVVVRRRRRGEGPAYVIGCGTESETAESLDHVQHALVRESLRYFELDEPLSIHSMSTASPGTGLGGSSAFVVGLLRALGVLQGRSMSAAELAHAAFTVEVERAGRPVGYQDHAYAAHGGVRMFTFDEKGAHSGNPIHPSTEFLSSLFLLRMQGTRSAAEVLSKMQLGAEDRATRMAEVRASAIALADELAGACDLRTIGEMLDRGWQVKRALGASTLEVDQAYAKARTSGALGGKLLGAGKAGYLLLLVPEERLAQVTATFPEQELLSVACDPHGSRVVAYER